VVKREPISFLATAAPRETVLFYRDVLGLELTEDSPFALVFSDNGHMLRIQKVPDHTPVSHTAFGWKVENISAEIDSLSAKGVKFSFYPPTNAIRQWSMDKSRRTQSCLV
jgi:hypothetical protein